MRIGQGSCAQVFRATALHTGHEYAIKVVDRRLVGEKAWRIAIQEAKVLRQLHHPRPRPGTTAPHRGPRCQPTLAAAATAGLWWTEILPEKLG